MKTIFMILIAMSLLCTSGTPSQQTYTVSIPGTDHYINFNPNNGGYGSGSNILYAGKNGDEYRSYIYWSNIRSYVPVGSQVTQVKFFVTWGGQGSQIAQIDYRDFNFGSGISQTYQNIGSGTLWGTLIATQTEYSFTQLTAKVQNAVNGGNNNVWIGIKNQNESSVDYFVNYLYNVSLEVTYQGSEVIVTQVDEAGIPFGQVGRWLNSDWDLKDVPFTLDLQIGSDLALQSDTNYNFETYQKYWKWSQNSNDYTTNHHNFIVLSGSNMLRATHKVADEDVRLKNNLEATGIEGGKIEIADPWLIDYPDPLFGYTERNRGMKQTGDDALLFYQRQTPFRFSYDNQHKGVFLGQDPSQTPTYYKVGMLEEQPITINGQERKFFPYKWQNDGGVTFQDEYARQTGVVFTSTEAIATAVLKGQLMSNDQNGVKNPSQRKMVRTDNGQYHVVYESMGTVFYTYSLTSDFYGAWSPDEYLHYHGKNPAIDYDENMVAITFEEYDPQVGGDAKIHLYGFSPSGNGFYYLWNTAVIAEYPNSYYGNAKPAITFNTDHDHGVIFVAYRKNSTEDIKYNTTRIVNNLWSLSSYEGYIPATNNYCISPSVTGKSGIGQTDYIYMAYENSSNIYYTFAYWGGADWYFPLVQPINLSSDCGFNFNSYPVISLSFNSPNYYVMVSWRGIYNGTPTNPLPKTDGTKPLYREAAVVKTGWGTSWGTSSNFSNNVDFTNNGSLNTAYGSIMSWSESDGQYSKYVRRRLPTGYDPITPLAQNGIHNLVSNGSEFGNVKAMVFNNSTTPPFLLNLSTNDFTYIPDGFGKISESGIIDISYGRSGIVTKNGIGFVFNIGDVLLNGETIKFVERADTLPVPSIEELNLSVRTDTLSLNPQSELIFSDYYYVVNSSWADSLLNNAFNVNFKCELVKLATGDVVGEFEEVNYNKSNLEDYGYQGYLVDCSGIEAGDYYLRLTSSVNEEVNLSLSDIQMDNVLLEKSKLNVKNFKGESIPVEYSLEQNYPNPFNPTTTISYQLPNDGMVTLKVYDILGAEVATLVNEEMVAGKYEVNFDASRLASGVYIYRLQANDYISVKKMVLLR